MAGKREMEELDYVSCIAVFSRGGNRTPNNGLLRYWSRIHERDNSSRRRKRLAGRNRLLVATGGRNGGGHNTLGTDQNRRRKMRYRTVLSVPDAVREGRKGPRERFQSTGQRWRAAPTIYICMARQRGEELARFREQVRAGSGQGIEVNVTLGKLRTLVEEVT
jgi:hypothetical protein